jgi:hypothetical protein
MATVKIHEGTKNETSLDLQDDEGVIFVCPQKNLIWRNIPAGCLFFLHPGKKWKANLVITSKRLITIPLPPNKKNFAVESYYFKDMTKAKAVSQQQASQEAAMAVFSVSMKPGGNSSFLEGGQFWVCMESNLKNLFTAFKAHEAEDNARNAGVYNAGFALMDEGHYTQKSIDKYYAAIEKRAKEKAASMDFSKAGHAQIRDCIVDLINTCVEEVNK